ncbi:hypothetical protein RND81_10G085500 [Saponaria officinalis]|uniref:SWIM-type domain-containing protein n=1 Tax=Saponaria officinalis TaxID=3572 RepID=A0AAW1I255_SAPOF
MNLNEDLFDLNGDYDGETTVMDMNDGNNTFGQQFVQLFESNAKEVNVGDRETVGDAPAEQKLGMSFNCDEELAALLYTYAFKTGFKWFIRSNIDEFKFKGVKRNQAGEKEPRFHMLKRLRLQCKKGSKSKLDSELIGCGITQCNLVHNHSTDPSNSRLMDRIMVNDAAEISNVNNYNSLVLEGGGHENLPFNRRDIRNAINQERRRGRTMGDVAELEDYFDRMKSSSPDFYFSIQRDMDVKILNVAMCKDFGDAITYDTTFLCITTCLFHHLLGVNHHGSSIFLATALISHEDADSFIWVFEQWMVCMGKASSVILTDQAKNLGAHSSWREIERDLKNVAELVEKYQLHNNPWVKESYEIRSRWAFLNSRTGLCGFIEQFNCALHSKVEEEEQNNFACVDRPFRCDKSILVDDVFQKLYTNEKFKEVKGEVLGFLHTNVVIVLKMGSFTKFAAAEKIVNPVWKTARKTFDVTIDMVNGEFNYTCKLFEFRGILCHHIIRCIEIEDVKFNPDKYIVNRWREDLVRVYESVRVEYYDSA